MHARRKLVDYETRRQAGKSIVEHFVASDAFVRSWCFCCYLSTPYEVTTRYILRQIFQAERNACIPAWDAIAKSYELFALGPDTPLITGHKGIREPAVRIPVFPWDVDCFIIPGLAFDAHGGRLGYGKGYYDRILARCAKTTRIVAICYDWQVVDQQLPCEAHDVRMHQIITEKRVITCAPSE